jgi:hypothetical protein
MAVIKHKDKEYIVTRLTLEKQLEHLSFLRMNIVGEIKKQMVGLPLDLCKHIWDEARKEVKVVEFHRPEYKLECCRFECLVNALVLAVNDKDFRHKDGMEVLDRDVDGVGLIIIYEILGFPKVTKGE